jgi:hypothetical protein
LSDDNVFYYSDFEISEPEDTEDRFEAIFQPLREGLKLIHRRPSLLITSLKKVKKLKKRAAPGDAVRK